MHRALDSVDVELVPEHELDCADHYGQVLRAATSHQRVDGDVSDGGGLHGGWDGADNFRGVPLGTPKDSGDAFLRGSNHGKTVGPDLLQEELEFINLFVQRLAPLVRSPGNFCRSLCFEMAGNFVHEL